MSELETLRRCVAEIMRRYHDDFGEMESLISAWGKDPYVKAAYRQLRKEEG